MLCSPLGFTVQLPTLNSISLRVGDADVGVPVAHCRDVSGYLVSSVGFQLRN